MSKKELSSEEMGTLRRSRKPTVVLTANGEVDSHEEAQVFVHDLHLFVTVQLLEETPAVLSLPHAQQAVSDCTQTRHEAKLAYYGPHIPSLLRQYISYTPIVWSACGRPHRDTLTVLRSLSKSIARKRNFVSAEVLHQKLTPASPGNLETQRPAESRMLAPRGLSRLSGS